jgi:hypothetical protein
MAWRQNDFNVHGWREQASFELMAAELVRAVAEAAAAGPVDGVYFSQHGTIIAAPAVQPFVHHPVNISVVLL